MYLDSIITADPIDRETLTVPACVDCGGILYSGACYAIGECETADKRAVRHSNRDNAKAGMATLRAFTIRGGVD